MNMERIEALIRKFSEERDWEKFHNPKNLSMALKIGRAHV